jgi:hypothetical protein
MVFMPSILNPAFPPGKFQVPEMEMPCATARLHMQD